MTVETYYAEIIPSECTQGYDSNNYLSFYPTLQFFVQEDRINYNRNPINNEYMYYDDSFHISIQIDYSPGTTYAIAVKYDWHDSPAKDYTVKVYSKHNVQVKDENGD